MLVRRTVIQIGTIALVSLTWGVGVALAAAPSADISTTGNSTTSQTETNVQYEGGVGVDITVEINQQSTSTTGSDSNGNPPSGTETPAATDEPTSPPVASQGEAQPPLGDGFKFGQTNPETTTQPAGVAATSGFGSRSFNFQSTQVLAAMQRAASAVVPPVVAAAARQPLSLPQPAAPQPIDEFLLQISSLLASGFMPAVAGPLSATTALMSLPVLAVVMGVLIVSNRQRLRHQANRYTERLRRSGFVGAPRSDVAGSASFATPLQWVLSGRVITA